jgi:hypothetical protein
MSLSIMSCRLHLMITFIELAEQVELVRRDFLSHSYTLNQRAFWSMISWTFSRKPARKYQKSLRPVAKHRMDVKDGLNLLQSKNSVLVLTGVKVHPNLSLLTVHVHQPLLEIKTREMLSNWKNSVIIVESKFELN